MFTLCVVWSLLRGLLQLAGLAYTVHTVYCIPNRLRLSSTMLAVCLTAAGATKAASLLPQSDGSRRVYIDAGANWANTLRLYRDIEPAASTAPWEIYAFEASPLITPFLERYCTWLNGGGIGVAPSSCLPQSGSTAHLFRYAGAVGCPASRECMWSFFAKPLAALAPDPQLNSTELIKERLAEAQLASSRTRYTLIPAGVAAENTQITIDSNPQQLIRGGALTVNAKQESRYVFRVPVVDLVGWIRASFQPADQVVLKIDVEGVEHEIFDALTQGGGWDRIDVLAFECHARRGRRSCRDLMASVRAAAPHLKLYEENRHTRLPNGRVYDGIDSESTPNKKNILAMVQSCGLVPLGSANNSRVARAAAPAPAPLTGEPPPPPPPPGNSRTRHGTPHTAARHHTPRAHARAPRPRVNTSSA